MRFNLFCTISFLLSFNPVFSQQLFLPLNHSLNNQYDRYLNSTDFSFHTSVKPYLQSEVSRYINFDSLQGYENRHRDFIGKRKYPWWWRKLLKENFLSLKTDEYFFTVDPLFNFQGGYDMDESEQTFVNTRGIIINGSIKNDFSFSTSFYENQASFAGYLDTFIKETNVVPGQGRIRKFKGSQQNYDYSSASAYISYTPSKYFNFQLGYGKNFIGDGYRSMLLSDNAFNYPFLKITTNFWRIKYWNLYAEFLDLQEPYTYTNGYHRKYGSFHYLSLAVTKRLEVGLFEGIIYASDSSGQKGFDINYLNPIIFYRPVEFALGSPDNSQLGLNAKYKLSSRHLLYGQLFLDDFNFNETKKDGITFFQNKFGYQLGFKAYDIFKVQHLYFQLEYNRARPFTYGHKSVMQNYAHYNQSLAHPLGSNFSEVLTVAGYSFRNFSVDVKLIIANYGDDSLGTHYGHNIYLPDSLATKGVKSFGNEVGQGIATDITIADFKISYLLNPKTNMRLQAGVVMRNLSASSVRTPVTFIYFGWSTNLDNIYYDF